MKRLIDWHLKSWKESPHRKPLVLRGARQVGKLPLEVLVIYDCKQLKRLPDFLAQLYNLQILALTRTPLEGLPEGLEKLPHLREIRISKDVPLPPEIKFNPKIKITLTD